MDNSTTTESAETEEDREFIRFLWKLLGWREPDDDDEGRNIVITPYEGGYGLAGHVIAIEGNPPKGVVYVASGETVVVLGDGNAKTIRGDVTVHSARKLDTILDYLRHRGYEPANPV